MNDNNQEDKYDLLYGFTVQKQYIVELENKVIFWRTFGLLMAAISIVVALLAR